MLYPRIGRSNDPSYDLRRKYDDASRAVADLKVENAFMNGHRFTLNEHDFAKLLAPFLPADRSSSCNAHISTRKTHGIESST